MQEKLLEVTNLVTRFHTDDGMVTAVNNLCFDAGGERVHRGRVRVRQERDQHVHHAPFERGPVRGKRLHPL